MKADSLGVDLEGTQRAMLTLESADGTVSGDHLGFCKLKRAQATSSAEAEINRLIYSTQMRALPGRHHL